MVRTEQLAQAALAGDALGLRALVQDWLLENPRISDAPAPDSSDAAVLVVAAGLVELLAERRQALPPEWTRRVGAAPTPIFLVRAARRMKRLRHLCETEAPQPLRRRNLLAPPDYLQSA